MSFLAVFAFPDPCSSQVPLSPHVIVRGNSAVSSNEILSLLVDVNTNTTNPAALENHHKRIRDRYRSLGYLFADVNFVSTGDRSSELLVDIHEGLPAVIESVGVDGVRAASRENVLYALGLEPGDVFVESVVEEGIRKILSLYEQEGYQTARISVTGLEVTPRETYHSVNFRLNIDEGALARVDEVRVEGNRTTRSQVILREINLGENPVFTDARAALVRRSLENLQLFSSVSIPEFFFTDDGRGIMVVKVQEGDPNRFDGMIGYHPGAGGQKAFLSGLVNVHLGNLFGTGRKLSTRWLRESRYSQELTLRYREPWLAGVPLHLEVGFFQRKQDTTYVKHALDGGLLMRIGPQLTGGLTGEWSEVTPSETPGNLIASSSHWSLGATLLYDTRDNPLTPTDGLLYSTTYEVGRKTVSGAGSQSTGRLTFDLEVFVPIARTQVITTSVHGRDLSSALLEPADLFRIGGALSLRGYRENQFQGSRILWAGAEYRFLTGGRSYLYAFVDAGYIKAPDKSAAGLTGLEITRIGYGIGTRLDTQIGLLTVGIALGQGDTFKTAKLHFRLANDF